MLLILVCTFFSQKAVSFVCRSQGGADFHCSSLPSATHYMVHVTLHLKVHQSAGADFWRGQGTEGRSCQQKPSTDRKAFCFVKQDPTL